MFQQWTKLFGPYFIGGTPKTQRKDPPTICTIFLPSTAKFCKILKFVRFWIFQVNPACTRESSESTDFSYVFEKSSKMEVCVTILFHNIFWGFTEGFRVSFHNIYKNAILVLGTFQPTLRFFLNLHIVPRARACTRVRVCHRTPNVRSHTSFQTAWKVLKI